MKGKETNQNKRLQHYSTTLLLISFKLPNKPAAMPWLGSQMILLFLPEPQGSPPALGSATYPMGKHTQQHPVEARLPKQAPKIQSLRHYQPLCHVPAHAREACRTVSTTARPELCPTGFYSRPLNQAHGQRGEFRSPLSSCLLFPQKDQAAPLWVFGELQHKCTACQAQAKERHPAVLTAVSRARGNDTNQPCSHCLHTAT